MYENIPIKCFYVCIIKCSKIAFINVNEFSVSSGSLGGDVRVFSISLI